MFFRYDVENSPNIDMNMLFRFEVSTDLVLSLRAAVNAAYNTSGNPFKRDNKYWRLCLTGSIRAHS